MPASSYQFSLNSNHSSSEEYARSSATIFSISCIITAPCFCVHYIIGGRQLFDILRNGLSERSGRGVPKITQIYGREAIEFTENCIIVTIPLKKADLEVGDKVRDKVGDKVGDKNPQLNSTRRGILKAMRNNPNITQPQLMAVIGISRTAIQKNVSFLRKNGYIERIGSNKNGYWKVL